jgi:DNA primase
VQLPEGLAGSGQKGAALLLELHALLAERPELRSAAIIERYRERPEGPHLEALLAADPLVPEDGARQELAGCLRRFASAAQQQRLNELLGRAAGLTPGEQAELEQLRRAVARGPGPRQDDAGPADRT